MKHDPFREKLLRLLDGDVSGTERAELEEHLETCAACRRELDALKSTLELVSADVPPPFERVVWQPRPTRRVRLFRWALVPLAAAVALAFFVFGGDMLRRSSTQESSWVMVDGDSLSVDEGLELTALLIMEDEELRDELVSYAESKPVDIYTELEELGSDEEEELISVLEEMLEEFERS